MYRHDPMPWVAQLLKKKAATVMTAGRVLLPRGRWTPTSMERCFGVLFGSVAGCQHHWLPGGLLLVSIVTVAVSASPAGVDNVTGCTVLHAVLAVLSSLPGVMIVLRRGPYRIVAMNGFTVVNAILTSLTALVNAVALQHHQYADTAMRVSDALATVLYVSAAVRGVLLMGLRVTARLYGSHSSEANTKGATVIVELSRPDDVLLHTTAVHTTPPTDVHHMCTTAALAEIVDLVCASARLRSQVQMR